MWALLPSLLSSPHVDPPAAAPQNRGVLAKVLSCAVVGLDGELVDLEVDITRSQLPATTVVGLPDTAVQESRERVRSAIRNSGLSWPNGSKVTISLDPADLRKEGPAYDLPIATGILLASGQVVADVEDAVFIGERPSRSRAIPGSSQGSLPRDRPCAHRAGSASAHTG